LQKDCNVGGGFRPCIAKENLEHFDDQRGLGEVSTHTGALKLRAVEDQLSLSTDGEILRRDSGFDKATSADTAGEVDGPIGVGSTLRGEIASDLHAKRAACDVLFAVDAESSSKLPPNGAGWQLGAVAVGEREFLVSDERGRESIERRRSDGRPEVAASVDGRDQILDGLIRPRMS
jgi:hypothetical protein